MFQKFHSHSTTSISTMEFTTNYYNRNAPLPSHQLNRVARHRALRLAQVGVHGVAHNRMSGDESIETLFRAAREAIEEVILNSIDYCGRDGRTGFQGYRLRITGG
ncbi:hypothetical protein NHQ30_008972 [Ciborinia camelliae]|nr:hypothetical protein NHQ30_008972 [Ciborinia camelliae]